MSAEQIAGELGNSLSTEHIGGAASCSKTGLNAGVALPVPNLSGNTRDASKP